MKTSGWFEHIASGPSNWSRISRQGVSLGHSQHWGPGHDDDDNGENDDGEDYDDDGEDHDDDGDEDDMAFSGPMRLQIS